MDSLQSTTTSLIPMLQNAVSYHTRPGVSARVLYTFLGLNPSAWARWAKKNIIENAYAIEHEDWNRFQHDVENRTDTSVGGRPTQDYALSLDFAKRLSMMARSVKGEEARQYFLDCERRMNTPTLPTLHDPVSQALMHVLIENDATKHRLALLAKENIELRANDQRIEAKADSAVQNQNFWTVAEYVQYHDLRRQCPESTYAEGSRQMQAYCKRERLNFRDPNILPRRIPVGAKNWETEWGFHTSVYEAAFLPWLKRRWSQEHLTLIHGTKPQEDASS